MKGFSHVFVDAPLMCPLEYLAHDRPAAGQLSWFDHHGVEHLRPAFSSSVVGWEDSLRGLVDVVGEGDETFLPK